MTTLKIPTFPIPSERELDARVAREIWGNEVQMLPAHREPECGSIVIWEPEFIESALKELEEDALGHSFMGNLLKQHSAALWHTVEGVTCGQLPAVLIKATNPEHSDRWEPLPHYSTSIAAAWELIELVRETEEWMRARFLDRLGNLHVFLMDCENQPKAICEAALQALGEKHEP
jgi:hypothetical protein